MLLRVMEPVVCWVDLEDEPVYARAIATVCLLGFLTASGRCAVIGRPKCAYQDRPDDKPCQHVELVDRSPFVYQIEFRGTVDGVMTRMPVGYGAFEQGWQPNRSVLIENVGQTDVHNPYLVVNGKRNWRTLEQIVAEATAGYTSAADRARAIWEFCRRHRFHACTWDAECNDAVKVFNVYGYTLCGNQARVINDLWKAAGLTTRRGYPIGHVVCEVFYDGAFHLMDSDEHVICLLRDNHTIASCAQVVRDHDLIKRTHTYGIGHREDRKTDEFSASLYVYEGPRQGDFGTNTRHSMEYVLRPGESIEFRWDHVGKEYSAGRLPPPGEPMRDGHGTLARWGPRAYDNLRNGKLRYKPDLHSRLAERGAQQIDNARFDTSSGTVEPVDWRRPAVITWRFASPYVFVGGVARATIARSEGGKVQWRYSTDQENWRLLGKAGSSQGSPVAALLDEVVSPAGQPTYQFWLQLVLEGRVAVGQLEFENDIQMAPLSLPELEVGTNRIVYSDSNTAGRKVRITHRWMERTTWHRPGAPQRAIWPADGQTVPGSKITFRWSEASDPDGDRIVDYHFELSEHADMRWPLSPNFEKLTSLTPSRGKPCWTVPYVGLLNPQTTYYWRVRARDSTGVWGPWSRTFSFRIEAPGVPLDVRLVPDDAGGLVLRWRANPVGQPPVAYKVYGSDERGFSISDTPYRAFRGKGFVQTMEQYEAKPADAPDAGLVEVPANLIARVTDSSLRVVGADLKMPNTNKTYYRVVAIDASGNESGPSDYAEVPRPMVVVHRRWTARLNKPFQYRLKAIRSIGDLRCRRSERSSYNAAFWDREHYSFEVEGLPEGLSLDGQTGLVSGTPRETGRFDLTVRATGDRGKSCTVRCYLIVEQ